MDNVSSGTAVPTKKRALPLVIVLITAVLAGLVMLYAAVANGYEGGSYSPMLKPVSVEKQLEPGTESSGDTLFDFELIVSPSTSMTSSTRLTRVTPELNPLRALSMT